MTTTKKLEIELPGDVGRTAYTLIGDKILFVTLEHDEGPENPCTDQDGFGMIRSFSSRHVNNIHPDEAQQMMEEDKDIVPLAYYEHGSSYWTVAAGPFPAGMEFQWDGVRFAGIWIPDDCVRESYMGQDGKTRQEWMIEQARAACETYTQWCNGEVYGYTVELYKQRLTDDGELYEDKRDYRKDDPISEDSCWGFYGWDYAKGEAKTAAEYCLKDEAAA